MAPPRPPRRAQLLVERRPDERVAEDELPGAATHLAHQRIVFDTEMNARMPAVHERHAQRCPIDLVVQDPDSDGELFWIIGRPPDGLAFTRSDRSGGNQR